MNTRLLIILASVGLLVSIPETGEVYDWMNHIIYPKHPVLD